MLVFSPLRTTCLNLSQRNCIPRKDFAAVGANDCGDKSVRGKEFYRIVFIIKFASVPKH